jgi:hypothetical protein
VAINKKEKIVKNSTPKPALVLKRIVTKDGIIINHTLAGASIPNCNIPDTPTIYNVKTRVIERNQ